MKKIAAILLSAVLLFNWYGFQPIMNWLDNRADEQMVAKIDNQQYNETSLIEISVPTNLPYTNNWAAFERTDGAIEFNGQHYNYVMRKMVDGKMIYKCIPNEQRNKISNAREAFFKQSFESEKVASSKKHDTNKSVSVKKMMDDFTNHQLSISFSFTGINNPSYTLANTILAHGFNVSPYQPPQA